MTLPLATIARLRHHAIAVDAALILIAVYAIEYLGGHAPCDLCWIQRYAWMATLTIAAAGVIRYHTPHRGDRHLRIPLPLGPRRGRARLQWHVSSWTLIDLGIAVSLLVGAGVAGYHVGVEAGWWTSNCSAPDLLINQPLSPTSGTNGEQSLNDVFEQLMAQPVVACALPTLKVFGFSLSQYNFVYSLVVLCLWLGIIRMTPPSRQRTSA